MTAFPEPWSISPGAPHVDRCHADDRRDLAVHAQVRRNGRGLVRHCCPGSTTRPTCLFADPTLVQPPFYRPATSTAQPPLPPSHLCRSACLRPPRWTRRTTRRRGPVPRRPPESDDPAGAYAHRPREPDKTVVTAGVAGRTVAIKPRPGPHGSALASARRTLGGHRSTRSSDGPSRSLNSSPPSRLPCLLGLQPSADQSLRHGRPP